MIDLTDYVDRGLEEVRTKTLRQVQYETAKVWYGRAIASSRLNRTEDAVEYAHEAIEHAALSGHEELLWTIREGLRLGGISV